MVMQFPGGLYKVLTLSYDDGTIWDKKLVEIMVKYGLKGTFNLDSGKLSAWIGGAKIDREDWKEPFTERNKLSADECKELYSSNGMEVAVHGYSHIHPTNYPSQMVAYEVLKDRDNLEKLMQTPIRGMAYAYGNYNDEVVSVLKACGIAYSRTTFSTLNFEMPSDWLRLPTTCHHNCPKLMELAETFIQPVPEVIGRRRPQMFYLWGHSYEFNDNNNWDVIENFAQKVGGRQDVWYATNIEIYDYVTAFKSLITTCDGRIVYNPTATTLYFLAGEKDYVIKPGETIKLN